MAAEKQEFTDEAGTTRWFLYDPVSKKLDQEPADIAPAVRSEPKTQRKCVMSEKDLKDARAYIEKHITNTYLKRIDAPVGVAPELRCWMEVN
jgi:hypothetical protein